MQPEYIRIYHWYIFHKSSLSKLDQSENLSFWILVWLVCFLDWRRIEWTWLGFEIMAIKIIISVIFYINLSLHNGWNALTKYISAYGELLIFSFWLRRSILWWNETSENYYLQGFWQDKSHIKIWFYRLINYSVSFDSTNIIFIGVLRR